MAFLRNFLLSSATVAIAFASAVVVPARLGSAESLALVSKWWALDLALLGATLALIYKLYDSAYVKGLSKKRQQLLRKLVSAKTFRLWLLVALFAVLIVASGVPDTIVPQAWRSVHASLVIGLFIGGLLLFFAFVPLMWNEFREFQIAAKAAEDEIASREDYLSAWSKGDKPSP